MINSELKKKPVPGMKNDKEPYISMRRIPRKLVVDDQGMPMEVIIPWKEFREIEELLGLDLDAAACDDLKTARQDREARKKEAFVDLDSI
jgi:hypothetical protein